MLSRPHRRTILKGLALGAGATLLSPFLRRIEAQGSLPPRLVLLVEGDTLKPSRVMPPEAFAALAAERRAAGVSREPSMSAGSYTNASPLITEGITLRRALEPLQPHLDDVNIVQGLSNKIGGWGHTGHYGALSSAKGSSSVPGGVTIDALLGERIGSDTAFPRLGVGVIDFPVESDGTISRREVTYGTSAAGPGTPLPLLTNPPSVHRRLFGSVASTESRTDFEMRAGLLDSAMEDLRRVRTRLGAPERAQLESMMTSLEALETRRSRMASLEEALLAGSPEVSDPYLSPHPLVRLEAQMELVTAALITGLTRVALVASGCSRSFSMRYTSLSPEIPGKHHFGHGGEYEGSDNVWWLTEIHHQHALMAARLIERLKATPEGDGTAWDNTLLVYTCDGGESHHANFDDWIVVAASGRNIPLQTARGGRHVLYPKLGSDRHRQLSNFWNTVGHAVGASLDDFGLEGAIRIAPGPLPELLRP